MVIEEVGCLRIEINSDGKIKTTAHPVLKNHPLKTNQDGIRDKLCAPVWNPAKLKPYSPGSPIPSGHEVIYDATGKGKAKAFLVRPQDSPECWPYIWVNIRKFLPLGK